MTKKNILTIVLAVALVAALAVGATLAYFTSQDTAENTFTMGNVAIDLKESNGTQVENGDLVWEDDGLEFAAVMPGDSVTKMAKVIVDSASADCYVRVTAALTTPEDTTLTAADIAALYTAIQTAIGSDWTVTAQADGALSCVYNAKAAADEELTLFTTIVIPAEIGNNAANQGFSIVLNAYAVQAANMGEDAAAIDWNSITFEA